MLRAHRMPSGFRHLSKTFSLIHNSMRRFVMKLRKTFVAPMLVAEETLSVLTLGAVLVSRR